MPSLSETALAAPFCARRSALSRSYLLSSVSSSCLQVGQLLWLDSQGAKHAEWNAWLHGISCTRSASSKSSLRSIAKTSELLAPQRQHAQWTCSPDMGMLSEIGQGWEGRTDTRCTGERSAQTPSYT